MAHDEVLAERVRAALTELLPEQPAPDERRMFGGSSFMLRGNFCCGVTGSDLVARIGADACQAALAEPGVRELDFTGRAMRGWVFVSPAAVESEGALGSWVGRTVAFARSLPAK